VNFVKKGLVKRGKSMEAKVFLLSKKIRNKILFFDILIFLLLLCFAVFIYVFFDKIRSFFVFIPVLLFIIYKSFLFSKRGQALIICKRRIYSWRSGWVADKEIKDVYLGHDGKNKCIFFNLNFGWYAPTVYSDWTLYSLPSTLIVLCEDDCVEPIESIFEAIKAAIKSV
jgi:hypothetical protein